MQFLKENLEFNLVVKPSANFWSFRKCNINENSIYISKSFLDIFSNDH